MPTDGLDTGHQDLARVGGVIGKVGIRGLRLPANDQILLIDIVLSDGKSDCKDGEDPASTLVRNGAGRLFGTTNKGGKFGKGTVFELVP